ncbi:class F sortase [Pseudarthrobacter sp. N5]|uniref:class F sortase n=1 Tax=Pseudarthrobacter sp. N5 TaxID=3418416 RepID=UPI003CF79BA0
MASRHRTRKLQGAGTPGLLLGYRDFLVLSTCVLGLLVAWLVYGASGPGNPHAAFGAEVSAGTPLLSDPGELRATASPLASPGRDEAAVQAAATGPAAAQPAVTGPPASAPRRITYQAAGMDVVVHQLQPDGGDVENRSIAPPETMDGYWLSPFGAPGAGSANTTYVIGHSWEGLDAPFNHLSSAASPGDEFTVGTETGAMTYRVDSVTTYTKSTLKDSPIWAVVPNRLVLISCYTEDPWGKNVAVVASPVPGR